MTGFISEFDKIELKKELNLEKENELKPEENLVKKTCRELGITQKELAEMMGVNDGTPAQWNIKGNIPKWGENFMNLLIINYKNQQIAESFKNIIRLSQAM